MSQPQEEQPKPPVEPQQQPQQVEPEAHAHPEPEVHAHPEPEVHSHPEPEVHSHPEPEVHAHPEPEAHAHPKPEPEQIQPPQPQKQPSSYNCEIRYSGKATHKNGADRIKEHLEVKYPGLAIIADTDPQNENVYDVQIKKSGEPLVKEQYSVEQIQNEVSEALQQLENKMNAAFAGLGIDVNKEFVKPPSLLEEITQAIQQ